MDQKRLTVRFQVTFDIRLIVEPVTVKSGEVYLNINLIFQSELGNKVITC